MKDVLIASYAVGEKYCNYLPVFLYTAQKVYPKCSFKIFIDKYIPDNVLSAISLLGLENNIVIDTNSKHLLKDNTNTENKHRLINASRWIGFDEEDFDGYKYVFLFPDIDFFIIKQKPSVIESKINFIQENKIPYSNALRDDDRPYCFCGNLHFIETHSWFTAINDVLNQFRVLAQQNNFSFLSHPNNTIPNYLGDEQLIYNLIEQSGLPIISHKTSSNGIHIGFARQKKIQFLHKISNNWQRQYIDCFENNIMFRKILSLLSKEVEQHYVFVYSTFKNKIQHKK